ncbi:hypothetical protein EFA59_05940 [Weissella hellenica]|nr:hypothetical protein EFA59_05940 [Weissella hellenica]
MTQPTFNTCYNEYNERQITQLTSKVKQLFVQFYQICSKTAQNHDFMKSLSILRSKQVNKKRFISQSFKGKRYLKWITIK